MDIVIIIENYKGEGYYDQVVIYYYRIRLGISQDYYLIVGGYSIVRFYMFDKDLIDIVIVWRIGFFFCKSIGNLVLDIRKDITVDCDM